MCTAMTLQTQRGELFFGRTMDFSYPLDPSVYTVPRNYAWTNAMKTGRIQNRYAYIGTGQEIPALTVADGVNEQGLAAAALYFPGFAAFDKPEQSKGAPQLAAVEVVGFLLGVCASVDEAARTLLSVRIVGLPDAVTGTVAPLHWIVCDRSGKCITVEQTETGLQIIPNPVGVLSNSPGFDWHLQNLRNYTMAAPEQEASVQWDGTTLTPFGQGAGTSALPGGYTPPARFVRTVFQKTHVRVPKTGPEAVVTGFHILEGVSIPRGVVRTILNADDYTQYMVFMNTVTGEYFVRTYDNSQVRTAALTEAAASAAAPVQVGRLAGPPAFVPLSGT